MKTSAWLVGAVGVSLSLLAETATRATSVTQSDDRHGAGGSASSSSYHQGAPGSPSGYHSAGSGSWSGDHRGGSVPPGGYHGGGTVSSGGYYRGGSGSFNGYHGGYRHRYYWRGGYYNGYYLPFGYYYLTLPMDDSPTVVYESPPPVAYESPPPVVYETPAPVVYSSSPPVTYSPPTVVYGSPAPAPALVATVQPPPAPPSAPEQPVAVADTTPLPKKLGRANRSEQMTPPALQEIPEKSWWEKNSLPIVVGEIGVVVLLLGAMFRPAVHKLAGPS